VAYACAIHNCMLPGLRDPWGLHLGSATPRRRLVLQLNDWYIVANRSMERPAPQCNWQLLVRDARHCSRCGLASVIGVDHIPCQMVLITSRAAVRRSSYHLQPLPLCPLRACCLWRSSSHPCFFTLLAQQRRDSVSLSYALSA
jgi:hypothetical protein